jgi:hypothetical protein
MFEAQADQRRQFAQLADSHGLDTTVIQRPHRAYHPATPQAGLGNGTPTGPVGEMDQALAAIAGQAGATLRIYPRPGPAARRMVLRDERDDRGTRYLDAALERTAPCESGHDQGLRVSEFFGAAITSYEWVYVVAADRVPALIRLLGGHDVLALLTAYHQRAGEQISDLMNHPNVAAHFSNWHS